MTCRQVIQWIAITQQSSLKCDYTYNIHTSLHKLAMRQCETGVQIRPLCALAARRWSRALVSLPIEAAMWPPVCTNENTHYVHILFIWIICSSISFCIWLLYSYTSWHIAQLSVMCIVCDISRRQGGHSAMRNSKTIYKMTFWEFFNYAIKLHQHRSKSLVLYKMAGLDQIKFI